MRTWPCHSCGANVAEPKFKNAEEEKDFMREVDNFEGCSPIMCDECEEHFSKVKEAKTDEPQIIREMRGIVESKSMGGVHRKDGTKAKIDLFSASAVVQVYDKLKPENRVKMLEKVKYDPYYLCNFVFKLLNKTKGAA